MGKKSSKKAHLWIFKMDFSNSENLERYTPPLPPLQKKTIFVFVLFSRKKNLFLKKGTACGYGTQ